MQVVSPVDAAHRVAASVSSTRSSAAPSPLARVLFVHGCYQQRGGEDTVVDAEMALLRSHGHAVELYSRDNFDLERMSGLKAGVHAVWSARTIREVGALIQRFRPDVVHVHNTFPLISPSVYWAAGRAGVPTVQTLHNFRLLCPQAMLLRDETVCEDCIGRLPWRGVLHRCYRDSAGQTAVIAGMLALHRAMGTWHEKVSRYVALSEFSRGRYVAGGFPAGRIVVKPNFAEVPAGRREDGMRDGFLFVGRLSAEKGVGALAEAMRRLPAVKLRVAGDGPLASVFEGLPNVSMLGRLPRIEVYREMRGARALILPSICHENCPVAVIEALGSGLPVIGSDLGGIPELVEHGTTGLLVRPGCTDSLVAAIVDANADVAFLARASVAARVEYERCHTPEVGYARQRRLYEFGGGSVDGSVA